MRVLVTGACGWTAAPIVEAVAEAGHEVDGFDVVYKNLNLVYCVHEED